MCAMILIVPQKKIGTENLNFTGTGMCNLLASKPITINHIGAFDRCVLLEVRATWNMEVTTREYTLRHFLTFKKLEFDFYF